MDVQLARVDELITRMDEVLSKRYSVRGRALKQEYRTKAGAYFSPLARRLRLVDHSTLADLLDDAVGAGRVSELERRDVLRADIVLSGKRRDDGADVYLLVEVSGAIAPNDVARAATRAAALEKLGRPVLPVVAGLASTPDVNALAAQRGVWRVLDGYDQPPIQA